MRVRNFALAALLSCGGFLAAQTPEPTPTPSASATPEATASAMPESTPGATPADNNSAVAAETPATMRAGTPIHFLPPPMEGTISLGIYDRAGKLVRTLHREAVIDGKEFVVDSDALVTSWDGRDDAGKLAAPGIYRARGYAVGNLKVKGEAILGNDWIVDADSPRMVEIKELFALPAGGFGISARLADGKIAKGAFDAAGNASTETGGLMTKAVIREGKVVLSDDAGEHVIAAQGLVAPIFACPARGGGVWVIDRETAGISVKQFAADGAFERHLGIPAGEPQPEQIAASPVADTIYLLERSPGEQRLRALTLVAPASPAPAPSSSASGPPGTSEAPTSAWKVLFKKSIWKSDQLAAVQARLTLPGGGAFTPAETIPVKLVENPLANDAPKRASLSASIESDGSTLKLADGLPLFPISKTPHLRWIAMAADRAGRLVVCQSDGAAVEEFRITQPAAMMAFDAGEVERPGPPPEPGH